MVTALFSPSGRCGAVFDSQPNEYRQYFTRIRRTGHGRHSYPGLILPAGMDRAVGCLACFSGGWPGIAPFSRARYEPARRSPRRAALARFAIGCDWLFPCRQRARTKAGTRQGRRHRRSLPQKGAHVVAPDASSGSEAAACSGRTCPAVAAGYSGRIVPPAGLTSCRKGGGNQSMRTAVP